MKRPITHLLTSLTTVSTTVLLVVVLLGAVVLFLGDRAAHILQARHLAASSAPTAPALLMTDTFVRPPGASPRYAWLAPDDKVFAWMDTAYGIKVPLPKDHGCGYTIDTEVTETTSLTDGPAMVVLFPDKQAFALSLVDGATWAFDQNLPTRSFSIPRTTTLNDRLQLRLDIPHRAGELVTAAINNTPVFSQPLPSDEPGQPSVLLLRRGPQGEAAFRSLSVRDYDRLLPDDVTGGGTPAPR